MSLSERVLGVEGKWLMGSFIPKELLRHIEDHLAVVAPGRERQLRDEIKARTDEILDEDAELVVDGPSEGMLGLCAVVLASFEVLREPVGDERRTVALLQHVFLEVLRQSMDLTTKLLLRRGDPLGAAEQALPKSTAMYGSSMDFEFDRPDADTFEMRVVGCFFQRFFVRHDAMPVTTVLCAWDANWMRALDPATMGVTAERTSLLSLGDECCTFRVLRTDDPLAEYRDVLQGR